MEVSINEGTPRGMVYNGKSHLEMDDLGVPPFMETPICINMVFSLARFSRHGTSDAPEIDAPSGGWEPNSPALHVQWPMKKRAETSGCNY